MGQEQAQREIHEIWLRELTSIPTATGCEGRVVAWVEQWLSERPDLILEADRAGNLTIRRTKEPTADAALYITAHLDHPAFVIDSILGEDTIRASFRGGVMTPYFLGADVTAFTASDERIDGRIVSHEDAKAPERLFRQCDIVLEGDARALAPGDIVTWRLPVADINEGRLRAPACDDLAAVAAALAALDQLRDDESANVRVLLTVAEEVGFIGAIAACRLGTMPAGSRVIALENSRAMEGATIGGGPIVRVGDRLSIFSHALTASVCKAASDLAGESDKPVGTADPGKPSTFKWQRRLMPGGACEATAYQAFGYDATCVCLALANYHNMGNLDRVQEAMQKGETDIDAPIASESISIDDYHGLIELLVACGRKLDATDPIHEKLDTLYRERAFVLGSHMIPEENA